MLFWKRSKYIFKGYKYPNTSRVFSFKYIFIVFLSRSKWVCEALIGSLVPILYPCHVCYSVFTQEKHIKEHFRYKIILLYFFFCGGGRWQWFGSFTFYLPIQIFLIRNFVIEKKTIWWIQTSGWGLKIPLYYVKNFHIISS